MINLHKRYVAELGSELRILGVAVKHATDCPMEPCNKKCPAIWKISICCLLNKPRMWLTVHSVPSDLGLYHLLRPVCPNTLGKYCNRAQNKVLFSPLNKKYWCCRISTQHMLWYKLEASQCYSYLFFFQKHCHYLWLKTFRSLTCLNLCCIKVIQHSLQHGGSENVDITYMVSSLEYQVHFRWMGESNSPKIHPFF